MPCTTRTIKAAADVLPSGLYFPVFGLNTRKYGPEKTPYLDTFHAVIVPASLNIPLLKAGDKN